MSLRVVYRLIRRDRWGRVVHDTGEQPSQCFVVQFLELLEGLGRNLDPQTATDVAGAESTICEQEDDIAYYGRCDAAVGDDTHGIQVGTNAGVTAEDNENYVIDTLIDHSAVGAAGDLNYQAVTFVAPAVDGANVDFDITRTFLNESGNTITVKEITLVCKNSVDTKYHLLMRDVVADEAVDDEETLTVVYTLRTTA